MYDQPKYKPQGASDFFADGRAARPGIPGTIPRGHLKEDGHLHMGKVDGKLASTFPFPVSRQVLRRGQERYNIFCTPCHDAAGTGNGMIVLRGLKRPPSLHEARLLDSPPGHYFDVMTNGLGAMQDYAAQISAEDRWAIIAYIRALQLSQRAKLADVPAERLRELREKPRPQGAPQEPKAHP
jgi:mono/diheme cytochrome c family protein